jgi:hypothetical protein
MDQPFPLHSLANAHFYQKVNSALLQDAGSHPLLAALPTTGFDDDRVNALSVQEMRENEPRRSRSNNPHLCTYSHRFFRRDS